MTQAGWIILCLSVGTVTTLFGWCLFKVLTTPGETEHMHGTMEETPDCKGD